MLGHAGLPRAPHLFWRGRIALKIDQRATRGSRTQRIEHRPAGRIHGGDDQRHIDQIDERRGDSTHRGEELCSLFRITDVHLSQVHRQLTPQWLGSSGHVGYAQQCDRRAHRFGEGLCPLRKLVQRHRRMHPLEKDGPSVVGECIDEIELKLAHDTHVGLTTAQRSEQFGFTLGVDLEHAAGRVHELHAPYSVGRKPEGPAHWPQAAAQSTPHDAHRGRRTTEGCGTVRARSTAPEPAAHGRYRIAPRWRHRAGSSRTPRHRVGAAQPC